MKKLLTPCFLWACIAAPITTGVMQHPMQQPTLVAGGDTAPQPGCDAAEQRGHSVMGGRADMELASNGIPIGSQRFEESLAQASSNPHPSSFPYRLQRGAGQGQ